MNQEQQLSSGASVADGAGATGQRPLAGVTVDTSHLSSHYCNVSTANSTREEVVLSFGVNQDWDRSREDLAVSLLHRIILSPQHAKRLHERLSALMDEYEKRHGPLRD